MRIIAGPASENLPKNPGKNSTEFRKAAKAFIARATYASASFIAAFAAADAACYPFDPSRIVARAAARATDANAAVWRSVELDADFLAQGGSTSAIADRQLWPEGAPRNLSDFWSELKAELLARDEDWDVWTRWYDERIEGKPSRGEAYTRLPNIPIEVWNDDFTAANKWIKEHLPKALDPVDLSSLESLPEQILAAVQFTVGAAGDGRGEGAAGSMGSAGLNAGRRERFDEFHASRPIGEHVFGILDGAWGGGIAAGDHGGCGAHLAQGRRRAFGVLGAQSGEDGRFVAVGSDDGSERQQTRDQNLHSGGVEQFGSGGGAQDGVEDDRAEG